MYVDVRNLQQTCPRPAQYAGRIAGFANDLKLLTSDDFKRSSSRTSSMASATIWCPGPRWSIVTTPSWI
jgi:hypothetical protein